MLSCIKQLLTVGPKSFQAPLMHWRFYLPSRVLLSHCITRAFLHPTIGRSVSLGCVCGALQRQREQLFAIQTSEVYAQQKVVSMRLKRKANNKMLMKTPSPWVEDKMAAP